jgi:hypothetical protein
VEVARRFGKDNRELETHNNQLDPSADAATVLREMMERGNGEAARGRSSNFMFGLLLLAPFILSCNLLEVSEVGELDY